MCSINSNNCTIGNNIVCSSEYYYQILSSEALYTEKPSKIKVKVKIGVGNDLTLAEDEIEKYSVYVALLDSEGNEIEPKILAERKIRGY